MNYPFYFEPKNSLILFNLEKEFDFLSKLYSKKKLPKVLMISGNKGSGKSTLINHFFFSIFDEENYNVNTNSLSQSSIFFKHFRDDIFSNIIYIKGSDFQSVKIEDIRNLKSKIYQSTMINKDRFIVLDDIELFNQNSLNALLKIIEEPSNSNFFFLINNKSKPLLNTVSSRSLEIKINLSELQRIKIIENLIRTFELELIFDPKISRLSPGNFVKFNYLCKEFNISATGSFIENLTLLLNLYKKNKDILFINLAFFLADNHFSELQRKKILNSDKIYEMKSFIIDNLNNFLLYNINQKALLNAISLKLNNE